MFQFFAMTLGGCRRLFQGRLPNRALSLACLVFAIFIAQTSSSLCSKAWSSEQPNIVLIMADDMGYECVQSNGGTSYKTPQIDRLAAGGLRFTNCHSQPICTPTRVQIMTGIYNHRNYVQFGLLHESQTTFGHIMKKAGYATCITGKWQLKGGFDGPTKFGFDEYCLWQLTRRPNRYPNPGLEINGKEVDFKDGQYGPAICSDYACEFIAKNAKADKPFFLYYPMMLPHWPFEPTPDSADWDPKARRADKTEKGTGQKPKDLKYFADMVNYTDKIVGKIDDQLRESGVRENTVLIFTGDNGTAKSITSRMGDLVYPGGKGSPTENGTHVPLVVSWPGTVAKGKVRADLVDFSDMVPTIAELAGASLPEEITFDGISFAQQIKGAPPRAKPWIYCWYARNGNRPKASQHVRDEQFKLYSDGRLYDVKADLFEKKPLEKASLSEADQAKIKRFQKVLDSKKKVADMAKPPLK